MDGSDICLKSLPDEELMALCACGSRQAMDEIVSRYHGKLLDFAFRRLGDRETSADIAQCALVRAFESAGSFRLQSSFRTWLYAIALNLIRDEWRRRKQRKESLASEIEGVDDFIEAQNPSPEGSALDKMAARELWRAVGGLSENYNTVLILKFRQRLTYEEIAEVMGAPSGTVKSWVHYALKELRERLGPVECEV